MAVLKRASVRPNVRVRVGYLHRSTITPPPIAPFDADAIFADAMERFPKTMAKLAE